MSIIMREYVSYASIKCSLIFQTIDILPMSSWELASLEVHINKTRLANHRNSDSQNLPACKSKNQFFSNTPFYTNTKRTNIKRLYQYKKNTNTRVRLTINLMIDVLIVVWIVGLLWDQKTGSLLKSKTPQGQLGAYFTYVGCENPKIRYFERNIKGYLASRIKVSTVWSQDTFNPTSLPFYQESVDFFVVENPI